MTIPLGIYHHFKHTDVLYRVLGTATHTETDESLVVYQALNGPNEDRIFARPESMFLEEVDKPEHGYKGTRFVFVRP